MKGSHKEKTDKNPSLEYENTLQSGLNRIYIMLNTYRVHSPFQKLTSCPS